MKIAVYIEELDQIVRGEIPFVIAYGPEDDFRALLILDTDPQKCAKWRGDLTKNPEIREALFCAGRPVQHLDANGKEIEIH